MKLLQTTDKRPFGTDRAWTTGEKSEPDGSLGKGCSIPRWSCTSNRGQDALRCLEQMLCKGIVYSW